MNPRMLIAGVGNVFLGDDAFGVEVASRLARESLPEWVRVVDYGIRGVHLAFDLAEGRYETTVLVDAAARGGSPGTVYLIEPDVQPLAGAAGADAHGMTPQSVLATVQALGGCPGRVLLVGCEPLDVNERMGLSGPVERAVDEAIRMVRELIERESRE